MAEETQSTPKAEVAEKQGRPPKKKKSRPTNCVQTNKRIRRKNWYYRNGKYFANKQAYKLYAAEQAKKAAADNAKESKEASAAS